MTISDYELRGIKILALIGRFDSDYEAAEQDLYSVIKGNKNVIIDCNDLTYINSLGLRTFLMLLKSVSKENGKLVFCNLDDNIKTVFQITGFIHLFLIHNTLDEAIDTVLSNEH